MVFTTALGKQMYLTAAAAKAEHCCRCLQKLPGRLSAASWPTSQSRWAPADIFHPSSVHHHTATEKCSQQDG